MKPFSAEPYLRGSVGPLREHFRGIVPDFFGEEKLDAEKTTAIWRGMSERASKFANFSGEQSQNADAKLAELTESLKQYLDDDETKEKIEEYRTKLERWKARDVRALTEFEQEEQAELTRELAAMRAELTGPVQEWTDELDAHLVSLFSPEALAKADTFVWQLAPENARPWHELRHLDWVNIITMWGLTVGGALMIVGLFSRLASFGAAGLLLMFFLSMPPLPDLPPPPMAEGQYLYVNKNLIEMLACLLLATIPTGVWGGLDALIRGLLTRPLFKVGASEVAGGAAPGRGPDRTQSPYDR